MSTPAYTFYSRSEYFADLAQRAAAAQAGDRIAVATMTFDTREPRIMELMHALSQAAKKGATVHLLVDAHDFLALPGKIQPGPLWWHADLSRQLPEPFRGWMAELQAFEASGGHYTITNLPPKRFSNPYAGRSHIKAAVVNDYIYIGGCNLQSPEHTDIMAGRSHTQSADWVYEWLLTTARLGSTARAYAGTDQRLTCDDGTEILIDAGVPKQSIIYDHALQLIDEAREYIYLTCQYFPGGLTAQHLLAAHKRGVQVRIIFSPPQAHGSKAFGHMLYEARERLRLPASFFAGQRSVAAPLLHAKVLATDAGTLVGSHNYVPQGVWLGTAEIALYDTDQAFARSVIHKIDSQL